MKFNGAFQMLGRDGESVWQFAVVISQPGTKRTTHVEKHPASDDLRRCRLNAGDEIAFGRHYVARRAPVPSLAAVEEGWLVKK